MIRKILLPTASAFVFSLATANAFASDPWPECVDNPACNTGCSVSTLPAQASLGAGVIALAAAAAFVLRRRSRA